MRKEATEDSADIFGLDLDPDDALQDLIVEFFDRPHIAEYLDEVAAEIKKQGKSDA